MSGDPTVGSVRGPGGRGQAEHPCQDGPGTAERREHLPDSRRAGKALAAGRDRPGVTIHGGSGQTVLLQHAGRLIRHRQHTAGAIAGTHPASDPRSKASGAVEEQDQRRLHERQYSHTLQHRATDRALNQEAAKSISFKIDKAVPQTAATPLTQPDGQDGWYTKATAIKLTTTARASRCPTGTRE